MYIVLKLVSYTMFSGRFICIFYFREFLYSNNLYLKNTKTMIENPLLQIFTLYNKDIRYTCFKIDHISDHFWVLPSNTMIKLCPLYPIVRLMFWKYRFKYSSDKILYNLVTPSLLYLWLKMWMLHMYCLWKF